MNFLPTFLKIGLSDKEAIVYSTLLEKGEQKIADLLNRTKLKRGDLYYALDNLEKKKLIEKEDKRKKLHFRVTHPNRLQSLIEEKEKEVRTLGFEIKALLPFLISNYNLSNNKPGVKIVEGLDGMRFSMDDSLTSKTDILTVLNPAEVDKYITEENKDYVKKRYQAGIRKKILVEDNIYNREHYKNLSNDLTEIRYLNGVLNTSGAVQQIYDNKINYTIIKPSGAIGMIIDNPIIVNLQRSIFNYLWALSGK